MNPVFRNVVARYLLRAKGQRPVVAEQLSCGHWISTQVAAHWVQKKQFPKKPTRQKLCKDCATLGVSPVDKPPAHWIVLQEKFDLLTEMAKAFAAGLAEDKKS